MENIIRGLFGTPKPSAASTEDNDFADFAGAPDPSPASYAGTGVPVNENPAFATGIPAVPYTKWYRVWERTTPKDFIQEAIVLPFIILIVGLHAWGRRKNRRKARSWATAHAPALQKEFAVVGFGGRKQPSLEDVQADGLAKAMASDSLVAPEELLKEKTAQEFTSYATGRQNIAFLDIKISLFKRYNPLTLMLEYILSSIFDSFRPPTERVETIAYTFDGKEKDLVPVPNQQEQDELEARLRGVQSSYDGFVWAIVHKDTMRYLREDRYDISLTYTKDNAKLPSWASVMSESAEITNMLLTDDLVKAVEQAGESIFENLIITDQPLDKPQKLQDTTPHKRVSLSLRLPPSIHSQSYTPSLPLFAHFLRLPDLLASSAHFRPEVLRKIRTTRDDEVKKLKRLDDEEKAEERKLEADRRKKVERDARLKGLSAEEQRKVLEREREKDQRKSQKRMTKKG